MKPIEPVALAPRQAPSSVSGRVPATLSIVWPSGLRRAYETGSVESLSMQTTSPLVRTQTLPNAALAGAGRARSRAVSPNGIVNLIPADSTGESAGGDRLGLGTRREGRRHERRQGDARGGQDEPGGGALVGHDQP